MNLSHSLNTLIAFFLFINAVHCIRNLFLPRTGDISGISLSTTTENLSNVTNFQALLGAGRSLAYPFAAGMLLSISTLASENNWKVSDSGFSRFLGIPREEIVDSYGELLETMETDENVTLSNILFSLKSNFSPSEALTETLMTEVQEVTWTKSTWQKTYQLMVDHLGNVTNEKIDTLLVPPVTKIGTPFRKATEAVILSSFHYINGWQKPWTGAELGKFLENDGIPYLKVEGSFLVAEEDEFTAVSVPLEGGSKSVVFVLPHVNITSRYFRKQAETDDGSENEHTDIVPFPKNWKLKQLRLKVPAFNTTDVDQYGQELDQNGMNETFCTIIRDYFGRYPYYLRPMVQVNFLDFNEDFLELASATGVAVEKFRSLFSIVEQVTGTNEDKMQQQPNDSKTPSKEFPSAVPRPTGNLIRKAAQDAGIVQENDTIPITEETEMNSASKPDITDKPENKFSEENNDIPTIFLNRPFLWYLNDSEVGPIFFGTVENLLNLALAQNSTEPGDSDDNPAPTTMAPDTEGEMNGNNMSNAVDTGILSDEEKFFLWSCRSFTPSSAGISNEKLQFSLEESFDENPSSTFDSRPLSSSPTAVGASESDGVNSTTTAAKSSLS